MDLIIAELLMVFSFVKDCPSRNMHMHVYDEKNYASSANRATSGRAARRLDQALSGRRDRMRF
ncbi:MAG: hypothetical protein ACXU89_16360 [Xanthobacteraceae bacterium]